MSHVFLNVTISNICAFCSVSLLYSSCVLNFCSIWALHATGVYTIECIQEEINPWSIYKIWMPWSGLWHQGVFSVLDWKMGKQLIVLCRFYSRLLVLDGKKRNLKDEIYEGSWTGLWTTHRGDTWGEYGSFMGHEGCRGCWFTSQCTLKRWKYTLKHSQHVPGWGNNIPFH